jgi:hypothetical protein
MMSPHATPKVGTRRRAARWPRRRAPSRVQAARLEAVLRLRVGEQQEPVARLGRGERGEDEPRLGLAARVGDDRAIGAHERPVAVRGAGQRRTPPARSRTRGAAVRPTRACSARRLGARDGEPVGDGYPGDAAPARVDDAAAHAHRRGGPAGPRVAWRRRVGGAREVTRDRGRRGEGPSVAIAAAAVPRRSSRRAERRSMDGQRTGEPDAREARVARAQRTARDVARRRRASRMRHGRATAAVVRLDTQVTS